MAPGRGLLQRELKQSRPFPTAGEEAVLGVIRSADLLRRKFGAVLEPFGVSLQQYNVLRILRGAGGRGLPTLEIIDRMIEQAPGITRLIDRLADHGWADRSRCAEDRRVVYCRITQRGLELLDEVEPPLQSAHVQVLRGLSEAEQGTLVKLLEQLRGGSGIPAHDGEISPGT
ncbi:MAG: MarR family transcriptional regulator [Gemmatimonadota bacterium]|nr:MarR family transcriptional regulator [Gemmatimonadota bacterium]